MFWLLQRALVLAGAGLVLPLGINLISIATFIILSVQILALTLAFILFYSCC